MAEFKKINVQELKQRRYHVTADNLYWKQFKNNGFLLKEFGPVDYIDFSPIEPYYFAVSSSVRVQVYSPITKQVYKNLSRFQKNVYGATFRKDGKLICAGGDENQIKLFDVASKSLLRVFKGHTSPVHRCFFTQDNVHIASFSDDRSVCVWDIASENCVSSYQLHTDFVRSGACSPVSPHILLSGGYDNIVKLYDTRLSMEIVSLDHGAPVESVLFLPSGGIFISAGGTEIKVWDALNTGRLLAKLSPHHKTVTCLQLGSNGSRFLSGSLDRHVKVFDVTTFQEVHSMNMPSSVLSLGVSSNDNTMAVGMVDGLVSVARRDPIQKPIKYKEKKILQNAKQIEIAKKKVDTVISHKGHTAVLEVPQKYDKLLRKLRFKECLLHVLKRRTMNYMPHVTVSIIQELLRLGNLSPVLADRNEAVLLPFLKFINRYISDIRFSRVLLEAASSFLDIHGNTILFCTPEIVEQFHLMQQNVQAELDLVEHILPLLGAMELIVNASRLGSIEESSRMQNLSLKPSKSATDFIINVS